VLLARLSLRFIHRVRGNRALLADLWLIPVRDLLLCWVWCRSFFTTSFTWRGSDFCVAADGTMRKLAPAVEVAPRDARRRGRQTGTLS
jgi:hypothetical protein